MTVGRLTTCAMILGLVVAGGSPVRAEAALSLPTPRSHYETFTPGLSGLPLLQNLLNGLDPQTQTTVLTFVASSQTTLSKEQALARLKENRTGAPGNRSYWSLSSINRRCST
jgi:hypothetical protein